MNTVTMVLNDLGYSEEVALQEFALLNASQKLSEFEQENQFFERKYTSIFVDFEKKLKLSTNENFEQDDDYLAWKFSFDGISFWRTRIEQLRQRI